MIDFQETIDGILDMATDDCVVTLAGEGKSYQEARTRALEWPRSSPRRIWT